MVRVHYTWLHMIMVVIHGLFMVHGYSRLYIVILYKVTRSYTQLEYIIHGYIWLW